MTVYRIPTRLRLARRSRTLPIFGRGDDKGRYFRCWNCGFICDSQRDDHGSNAAGDDHKDYMLQAASNYRAGIGPRPVATLDVLGHYQVALAQKIPLSTTEDSVTFGGDPLTFGSTPVTLGTSVSTTSSTADTTPKLTYHHMKSNVTHGCPFCGTTNYKGNR